MNSRAGYHDPACMVAHNMMNKLSDIIGYCDLIMEKVEPGTELERRIGMIRKIAEGAAKELREHQAQAEEQGRAMDRPKAG